MQQVPSIDRLLNLVPDSPSTVLVQLQAHPELASRQDAHGYSLLHATVSYGHIDLLKTLVQEFHVDINIADEDGETCLFNAESVEMAQEVVAIGVNINAKNDEGQTAAEKLDDEDEQPAVAAYLREIGRQSGETTATVAQTAETDGFPAAQAGTSTNGDASDVRLPPPPLPNGININVGTMQQGEEGGEPDPEFRRRIEELAARQDFDGEESQRELRNLISDAVSGLNSEGQGPASRRRME